MKKFIVTGGSGFVGSHLVEKLLQEGNKVLNIDKLTYAANKRLPFDNHPDYEFMECDICDLNHLPHCDILINMCAESHVDNSISSPDIFEKSNVRGTLNLLNLVRGKTYNRPLFVQISTDEVYGSADFGENFNEKAMLNPSSPYSASKAAAEMFVIAYGKTYGIEYQITRSSNNYGERQYPEKLIPKILESLDNGERIPIHGDGSYKREWLYVKDNVDAIYEICLIGEPDINEVWNISSENKMTNLEVVREICKWKGIENPDDHIDFVNNRHGQDDEYSINCDKLRSITTWKPKHDTGLFNFLGYPEIKQKVPGCLPDLRPLDRVSDVLTGSSFDSLGNQTK